MSLHTLQSKEAFQDATQVIPGGVNSPVRAASAVDCTPLFIERGKGAHIWDIDGNQYLDYVGSWGPLIAGHAHPEVIEAVTTAAQKGLSFGAPTLEETLLAKELTSAYPSLDQVRLVNSGTEATMSALRLARGFTERNLIIKFEGCYHGHSDALLVEAGSGALTGGTPTSAGVPEQVAATTLVAPYNDEAKVQELFERFGNDIAAVIVEPVAGNMGLVPPQEGFLQLLREITQTYGSLLIFDEVMTGFRLSFGGAQALYNIEPDLTCLGKIVGGGLPLAAYGGKAAIMSKVAPAGSVYQAGTLAGNPLAVAAGLATLNILKQEGFYTALEARSAQLEKGFATLASTQSIPLQVNRVGAMMSIFFTEQAVSNLDTARSSDTHRFAQFYQNMRELGIYLPPSQFEAWFISAAHTKDDINETLLAAEQSLLLMS